MKPAFIFGLLLILSNQYCSSEDSLKFDLQPTLLLQANTEYNFMASSSLIVGPIVSDDKLKVIIGIGPTIDYSNEFLGIGIASGLCIRNTSPGAGTYGSLQLSLSHEIHKNEDNEYLLALKGAITGGAITFGSMIGYSFNNNDDNFFSWYRGWILIPEIAQQTVTPDAVTRVFPSVGGYKEFAPTIN